MFDFEERMNYASQDSLALSISSKNKGEWVHVGALQDRPLDQEQRNLCKHTLKRGNVHLAMRAQFEVLIFKVTSARYCLISQNRQVVENWRSASRTTDLAAMEITVDHQDDNREVQRPSD
ncbi:hypothetical protein AVEN_214914-1 [Araneus ventricosus]|uniref:Uncharacterized protein n=1 Tax=Araneus ventricosus TaxID=182803 RepID=A0A4Y2DBC9_ARAVE|nr:hypothetical protein AVEN_214914-1 [Araneus ventricosus]